MSKSGSISVLGGVLLLVCVGWFWRRTVSENEEKARQRDAEMVAAAVQVEDIAKNYGELTRVTESPKELGRFMVAACAPPARRNPNPEPSPRPKPNPNPHHSFWVDYYRNALAQGAAAASVLPVGSAIAPLPVGSVIVKEKKVWARRGAGESLIPNEADLKTQAIAGMIKRPAGTLPKSGDWEFFWFEEGKLTTTGLANCAGCHSGARRDYVFTELPMKAK